MINGVSEWRAFKESSIWDDICQELDIWIEEIRNQLESEEIDLGVVKALRGSAKALRHVKELPDNLIHLAEEARKEENEHE